MPRQFSGGVVRCSHLLALATLLLSTSSLTAQPAASTADRSSFSESFVHDTLDNGLEILIVRHRAQPLARIEFVVRNGAFTEGPGFCGLSHLYEHMFFRANRVYRYAMVMQREVWLAGGSDNASTHEEHVNYYMTLPAYNVERGLELMSIALRYPLFTEYDMDRERGIVLAEFDRNEANPFFNYQRAMDSALWGEMFTRKQPLGLRDVINSSTGAKMQEIQKKYYIPNNTLVIVAGDVEPEAVRDMIVEYMGDWERGSNPFAADPPQRATPLGRNLLVVRPAVSDRVLVEYRWHGPSVGLDDRATYAADALTLIMNRRQSGFYRRLVKDGPAIGASIGWPTRRYIGEITLSTTSSVDRAKDVMKEIRSEVEKMDDPDYFSDEELEIARTHMYVDQHDNYDDIDSYVHTLGFWWATSGLEYYRNYTANLRMVSRDDIREYVRKYIIGKPYVLGVATSQENIARLNLKEEEVLR